MHHNSCCRITRSRLPFSHDSLAQGGNPCRPRVRWHALCIPPATSSATRAKPANVEFERYRRGECNSKASEVLHVSSATSSCAPPSSSRDVPNPSLRRCLAHLPMHVVADVIYTSHSPQGMFSFRYIWPFVKANYDLFGLASHSKIIVSYNHREDVRSIR